jgi:Spy/CpxP family protein refolding chaperone
MRQRTKTRIALLAAALLAFPILNAAGQDKKDDSAPAPRGEGRWHAALAERLGLTADQEKRLEEFRAARRAEAEKFRGEMAGLREEREGLMKDPEANAAKLEGLIDRLAGLRAERMKAGLRSRTAWAKIFTAEQLEKMKTFRGRVADRARTMMRRGRMLRRHGFGPGGRERPGFRGEEFGWDRR